MGKLAFGWSEGGYFKDIQNQASDNGRLIREILQFPNGGTFIDVGANIGATSLIEAAANADIIAIEASPSIGELYQKNMIANNVTARFFNCAAAAEDGSIGFEHREFAAGTQVSIDSANKVHVRSIDSIVDKLALDAIHLVKIDVEGFEINLLKVARRTFEKYSP
ncbi:FkbM family methyltransferase [Hyphomonas oceanitis]|nr:FkbM family methyltransferase [Hyphomonas oceanitis]